MDDLERREQEGILGLGIVEPVLGDLDVRRHAAPFQRLPIRELEAEGHDLQQGAVREVHGLGTVRLAGGLRAHDGRPILVLEDRGDLLGLGFAALVDEHDDRHAGVRVRQVIRLDHDGLIAEARSLKIEPTGERTPRGDPVAILYIDGIPVASLMIGEGAGKLPEWREGRMMRPKWQETEG